MSDAAMDVGFTHIALMVRDIDRSIAFYAKFAGMRLVHRRKDGTGVAWITDGTRPFVIVLIEGESDHPLGGYQHLGVACATRDDIDRLAALATAEGVPVWGPQDYGPPVGYWAFLTDPDGHQLELSFGQHVAFTVGHPEG